MNEMARHFHRFHKDSMDETSGSIS
jgi:hypothetical protein